MSGPASNPRAEAGIDVGIVVRDSEAALRFYRDTLGLEHVADVPGLTGVMHRLQYGASVLKLVRPDQVPGPANPPGGFYEGTGIRYVTFGVPDLDAALSRCEEAGYRIAVKRTDVRPGVVIGIVEDPDGNWVEFIEKA